MKSKIALAFEKCKEQKRPALITYTVAGDNTKDNSLKILNSISKHADIIELGFPHNTPIADGGQIQGSSHRALKKGIKLKDVFQIVKKFKKSNSEKPLILMGYFNLIYQNGESNFIQNCKTSGVDGLIVVDLPPEEDNELCDLAIVRGISFIRLATPTTDKQRLEKVLQKTSGFLYYVSIAGITGSRKPDLSIVKDAVINIKQSTNIPIGVGFGIKSKNDIVKILDFADAVIVGSVLVNLIANNGPASDVKKKVIRKVEEFASIM